jgi:hypothetical protein
MGLGNWEGVFELFIALGVSYVAFVSAHPLNSERMHRFVYLTSQCVISCKYGLLYERRFLFITQMLSKADTIVHIFKQGRSSC